LQSQQPPPFDPTNPADFRGWPPKKFAQQRAGGQSTLRATTTHKCTNRVKLSALVRMTVATGCPGQRSSKMSNQMRF
jgi:hypothetical protein